MTKTDLLEFFKQNQHQYISGEELATHFGVTRAGIWKHIKSLQNDGIKFDAVTNKGYRLCCSILSAGQILENLDPALVAKFSHGKNIVCETFESIDSTNTYAKTKESAGIGLFCASEQKKGRGRRGNEFFSPKDSGIYFSVMFPPPHQKTTIFTVASAVAACEVLFEVSQKQTGIKWVNDILLEGKKVCGILTEGIFDMETQRLSSVIVGIGINLFTQNFPQEIQNKAGSLGLECDQNQLIAKIVNRFFQTLLLEKSEIIKKYSELSVVISKDISFEKDGDTIFATAKQFNEDGNLVCEQTKNIDGKNVTITHTLKAGEISILGDFYQN